MHQKVISYIHCYALCFRKWKESWWKHACVSRYQLTHPCASLQTSLCSIDIVTWAALFLGHTVLLLERCCLNTFVCCLCIQQHPFNFYHGHWLCCPMERDMWDVIELWAIIFDGFRRFLYVDCTNYYWSWYEAVKLNDYWDDNSNNNWETLKSIRHLNAWKSVPFGVFEANLKSLILKRI